MPVIYKCCECGTKIRSSDGTPPDCCLNDSCGARIASDRPDNDVVMPAFKSQSTKNNDNLYRQIEQGSETRAQIAADQLGVPVSEMSGMKVTNLNDRRDAEIAAMPVVNDITRHMDNTKHQPWVNGGRELLGGAPREGARTHAKIQSMFNR